MAPPIWCRKCNKTRKQDPSVKWRQPACKPGDPLCGDLAAPYCNTCWEKLLAQRSSSKIKRKAQSTWLEKWYQKEYGAKPCSKCGKVTAGEQFGDMFLCEDCINQWHSGRTRPMITNIKANSVANIVKLADAFIKKLAIEICPDCGGQGFTSTDRWNPTREHYTEESKCSTCDGEGAIGEEEEDEDYEPSPESIEKNKMFREQAEKAVAERKRHRIKMKELNQCPLCEGAKQRQGKPCVFCNPTGYPQGTWKAYKWRNQQREREGRDSF